MNADVLLKGQGALDAYAALLVNAWRNAVEQSFTGTGTRLDGVEFAFRSLPRTESEAAIGVVSPTRRDIAAVSAAWDRIRMDFPEAAFRMALFYLIPCGGYE